MVPSAPDAGCIAALERIELALDGALAPEELRELEAHLDACRDCAAHAGTLERIREALRTGCCEAAPPELAQRVRSALAELRGADGA